MLNWFKKLILNLFYNFQMCIRNFNLSIYYINYIPKVGYDILKYITPKSRQWIIYLRLGIPLEPRGILKYFKFYIPRFGWFGFRDMCRTWCIRKDANFIIINRFITIISNTFQCGTFFVFFFWLVILFYLLVIFHWMPHHNPKQRSGILNTFKLKKNLRINGKNRKQQYEERKW